MSDTYHVTWKVKREAVVDEDGTINTQKRRNLKSGVQEQFDKDIEATLGVAEEAEPATTIALCALVLSSIQTAIAVKEHLESRSETEKVEVSTPNGSFVEITGSSGDQSVKITHPNGDTETISVER